MVEDARVEANRAKLRAIVASRGAERPSAPVAFGEGAALVAGDESWVLVDGDAAGSLGPALVWARRSGSPVLQVVGEEGSGTVARRAGCFTGEIGVWRVGDGGLVPAEPDPVAELPAPPDVPEMARMLVDAGLEVTVEHGFLLGEYLGLEVARVVPGEDGPVLEVGVGKYDRELTSMVHDALPTAETLARAVRIVSEIRSEDAPPHPMKELARERWLRHRLVDHPALVGCAVLAPVPSPFARENLRQRATAAAAGTTEAGAEVLVVTSVGIDLDVVPTAADTRAHVAPDAELLVAVPERDAHELTRELAADLERPARVVGVSRSAHG